MNGTIKAFNKLLEHSLTKFFNVQRDDWDERILVVLWDYKTTSKRLMQHTPCRLVYGKEVVMPMEFVVLSPRVALLTQIIEEDALKKRLDALLELEEDRFLAGFHQGVC